MGKSKHVAIVALLIGVSTLALRFLVFGPMFRLPIQASAEGVPIDNLFNGHFWMISFLFALIMVLMLYAVVVFRRRPDDDTDGPHVHGNTTLEVIWTVVPIVAVIGFGIWGTVVMGDLLAAEPNEMVVEVTGKQWQWTFAYPEQEVASPDLVLPVNRPIVLEMESEDVLHSFWVPEFRVKQDLVPGRTTHLRLTPTREGEYKVRCAEICGLEHAAMLANVSVLSPAAFDAWVEERSTRIDFAALTPEERGAIWYGPAGDGGFGCNSCHSLDGTRVVGPTWQELYGSERVFADGSSAVADDAYIRSSILNPAGQIVQDYPNAMPANYEQQFADKQAELQSIDGIDVDIIADIIAYMKTLAE